QIIHEDYLQSHRPIAFDMAILNPPYVRQEWIDNKELYRKQFYKKYGLEVPGTSNLYIYFLVKVIHDLEKGGRFCCVVYDSWQSTRFGQWLSAFLNRACSTLKLLPIKGQPFEGRLIDATIIIGRKKMS